MFRSLGQTPNRWASWLLGTHPYLNACKVLPCQMLLPIPQESGQILSYPRLPPASLLNDTTCPHLTSVPRQMGYAVLWLAYAPCRQPGSMLTSTWGPIFLPQNSLEISSNLPLISIQGQETSLSVNGGMGPRSKWRAGISVVWPNITLRRAARAILFLLQGARQPHSIGAPDARFISQYLNCMCKYFTCQLLFHWQLQQPQFIQHLQM